MKWHQRDEWYWERECARYTVCRSLVFDVNPEGSWVYLAWFRPATKGAVAQCISPERRGSFEAAAADCGAHIRQQKPERLAA